MHLCALCAVTYWAIVLISFNSASSSGLHGLRDPKEEKSFLSINMLLVMVKCSFQSHFYLITADREIPAWQTSWGGRSENTKTKKSYECFYFSSITNVYN